MPGGGKRSFRRKGRLKIAACGRIGECMKGLAEITRDALQLPLQERYSLAHTLLKGSESNAEVDAAWEAEIVKRLAAVDAGTAVSRPAEEVFADIERRFTR